MADVWESVISDFLHGRRALPSPLDRWQASYRGGAAGKVELDAFPEPYLGRLDREPRMVFLALNPGRADLRFQSETGVFAQEIRTMGSYRAWAASWPYLRDPWVAEKGKNRHHSGRLEFMRRWCGAALEPDAMLALELYPWHSTRVTGAIRPDPSIVREFIWDPIEELEDPLVFAFGAPWFPILEGKLGLEVIRRLGREGRRYPTRVASRTVMVMRSPGGALVVAEKHEGAAGPPSAEEVCLLKEELADLTG
jgi:hypothetical protein